MVGGKRGFEGLKNKLIATESRMVVTKGGKDGDTFKLAVRR